MITVSLVTSDKRLRVLDMKYDKGCRVTNKR